MPSNIAESRPNFLMQLASRRYAGPALKRLPQRVRRCHVRCSSLLPNTFVRRGNGRATSLWRVRRLAAD